MRTGLSRLLTTTAISAPLALTGIVADAASDIGKVAAVNPSMDGTPPQASSRQLSLGTGVLQNERIQTSDDGSGQLLFQDQTSLSIAPQSDLVLDKYVYDPAEDTGEVALTLTKGVLRMIGGRITKRSDGIVRTPTATIGVRGGLALMIVDPSGKTRVIHIAGQYTKITPLEGGEIILSRPNASAVVESGQGAKFDGLITSEELGEIYRQIEGNGNGGRTIAANAISTAKISGVNSNQKRGPNDQPVSTSGHSYAPAFGSIDEDRPRQDDTPQVVTVEVPIEEVIEEPEVIERVVVPPATPPAVEEPPILVPITDPAFAPFLTGLAGANVLNIERSGAAGTAFVEVLQGSLIGAGSDGSELRIPVPETDGVNDAEIDTETLLTTIEQNGVSFTGTSLAPGSDLFQFFIGDEEFNDFGDVIGGSFSSEIGDIRGVGFTDPTEQFTYVEYADEFGGPPSTGFAVFGDPTFGQLQFAAGDATIFADPGNSGRFIAEINPSLLTPDVVNGITNTVEAFAVQPNTFLNEVRGDAPRKGHAPFFMVGNQAFQRYGRSDTTIDSGPDIKANELAGGAKWLTGALSIGTSTSTGLQESSFMVFADDIVSFEGSGPVVSGSAFVSDFFVGFEEETGDEQLVFSTGSLNFGTLEDQDGNTVFGETNRYMVLSNLHRPGLDSESIVPPDFVNDAGSFVGLVQIEGDTSFDGTSNIYSEITEDAGDFNALLVRDSSQDAVINNPLPLAGARLETFYETPEPRQVDVLDRGFAAGMAVCEGGLCGDVDSFTADNTGLASEIVDFSGSYAVRSRNFDEFSLTFGGHDLVNINLADTPSEAVNFDTSNQVQAVFSVASNGVGNLEGANVEGNFARFQYQGGGTTSAYIDDNRFAALGQNSTTQVVTEGAGRRLFAPSSFAIASAGLVGTGDLEFPVETELEPEFARWGWWSSTLEAPIEGSTDTRTDIVHLGNWVAGVGFNFQTDSIPSNGTAAFDGLAVGTMTDLASFDRQIVGGNFDMTYNFGTQLGSFNLNIPAANLNENVALSGFNDVFDGRNVNTVNSTVTEVNGAFFANPNATDVEGLGRIDGIAGVGGTFLATDTANQVQTTGVFAGDRSNFTPPTSASVSPDAVSGSGVTAGSTVTGGPGVSSRVSLAGVR